MTEQDTQTTEGGAGQNGTTSTSHSGRSCLTTLLLQILIAILITSNTMLANNLIRGQWLVPKYLLFVFTITAFLQFAGRVVGFLTDTFLGHLPGPLAAIIKATGSTFILAIGLVINLWVISDFGPERMLAVFQRGVILVVAHLIFGFVTSYYDSDRRQQRLSPSAQIRRLSFASFMALLAVFLLFNAEIPALAGGEPEATVPAVTDERLEQATETPGATATLISVTQTAVATPAPATATHATTATDLPDLYPSVELDTISRNCQAQGNGQLNYVFDPPVFINPVGERISLARGTTFQLQWYTPETVEDRGRYLAIIWSAQEYDRQEVEAQPLHCELTTDSWHYLTNEDVGSTTVVARVQLVNLDEDGGLLLLSRLSNPIYINWE